VGKVNQEFEHLSDAQIENYGAPNHPRGEDQAVETHLAACAGCRTRLLDFHRTRLGLMIDLPVKAARRPDCPPEDSLRNLAAGIATATEAPRLTAHAGQCDHCGPILRAYTDDFSDDLSPDEQSLLSRAALSPARRQNIAEKLSAAVGVSAGSASPRIERSVADKDEVAQPPSAVQKKRSIGHGYEPLETPSGGQKAFANPSPKTPFFRLPWFRWAFIPVTAIACAVFAFFIWNSQRETPEKVEKLLAQAYTEQRTMEMRWPGAAYAPIRVTRGGEQSRFSEPAALMEAAAILIHHQDNPAWLRVQGEAAILGWHPELAITLLIRAANKQPDSSRITADLALAWLQKAEISGETTEYLRSLEYFNRALNSDPADTAALFNRAMVLNRLGESAKAKTDCQKLLVLEKDSLWPEECRTRTDDNKPSAPEGGTRLKPNP
jgi:hypothetical protein